MPCFDGDCSSQRVRRQPVVSVILQQRLVSATTSLMVTLWSCWHLCWYRLRRLLQHRLVSTATFCLGDLSLTTFCFCNSAAASCLSKDVFGVDLLVLLASVLVSAAGSPTAMPCFDDDLLSRRSRQRPVISVIQQQRLVSATTSLVATFWSCWHLCWYRLRRLLQHRLVSTATFCLGDLSLTTFCLCNSAAASCLSNDVFGVDHLVLLASVLVSAAGSPAAMPCFDDNLLSRRSRQRPVVSVIQQQHLVSATTSLVATF